MKTSIATTRSAELRERHQKELAELTAREQIESLLPESLPLPTISNIQHTPKPLTPYAWLSFHPEYGQDKKAFALRILSELEAHGAEPLPLSLCKWGAYRRSVYYGLTTDIPNEKRGCFGNMDELTDVDPIAPLYVEPNQHTGVGVRAFYRIAGYVFKVTVEAPLPARLHCRRVENMGGWRFDGACSIDFPKAWHSIYNVAPNDGECVANVSQHTRGYRDTEQGISGTIYWQPLTEQDQFPLTPAQFLAQLFNP